MAATGAFTGIAKRDAAGTITGRGLPGDAVSFPVARGCVLPNSPHVTAIRLLPGRYITWRAV